MDFATPVAMQPVCTLPPIEYARCAHGGLDARDAMRLAMAGHPVLISSTPDFFHLSAVLGRLDEAEEYRMLRKQTAPNRWLVLVVPREILEAARAEALRNRAN